MKAFIKKDKIEKKPQKLKTSINFVGIEEEKTNWPRFIQLIVTVVIIFVAFSKLAVYDRFERLWREEAKVEDLRREFEQEAAEIQSAKDMSDRYYHYTWSQMSDEEVSRVSRTKIAKLVSEIGEQIRGVTSYTLSEQSLQVNIKADSLESISKLAWSLEKKAMVESVSVQMAQTASFERNTSGEVDAKLVIYIKSRQKKDSEE